MQALDSKRNKDLIIMMMALGDALLEQGLFADAARRYQQLLQLKVANRKLYTNLSRAFLGLKRLDNEALHIYEKAVQYDPTNIEVYYTLATSFAKSGREDAHAMKVYENALRPDNPNFDKLADYMVTIYYKNQSFEKCQQVTQALLEKNGYQSRVLSLFLKSCWALEHHNVAIIQLKKLLDREESPSSILQYLAYAYLEKKFQGDLQNQELRFSYVDRQILGDYFETHTRFETLQDLSIYLELKRLFLTAGHWGRAESPGSGTQGEFVYHEATETDISAQSSSGSGKDSFDLRTDVLNKLRSFESLTGKGPGSHSSLTYEDFQKEGAAIFTHPPGRTEELLLPADIEIIVTLHLSNIEDLRHKFGEEQAQLVRNKFLTFMFDILEKYKLTSSWVLADGLLLFETNILRAISLGVEVLNKINRYNFTNESKDAILLAIGIHHARSALNPQDPESLKELSIGVKVATATARELPKAEQSLYRKLFQKTDRIFVTGKAYREIKSSNRFKVHSLGQFGLKYVKERLGLYEIVWRNPIHDLKFGFVKRLGRFDLLSEVSNRPAFRVFKAKDSGLQRFVILKVIQSEAFNSQPANSPQKTEFYRSAQVLAQVHHPNIANIYEVDEDQGLTYISREFVEGVTITDLFGGQPQLQIDRFVKVIYQICKALQHARRLDCCHLNLKPENILVGQNDEIKITDFLIPENLFKGHVDFTEAYDFELYRAPEHLRTGSGDERSDVYSLGVIMYEIVARRHPFVPAGQKRLSQASQETLVSPVRFNRNLPKFCEALILKCLAAEPDKRFQSFEQLVGILKKNFETKLFSNFNYQIAQARDSY